jgi:hypothetical protein
VYYFGNDLVFLEFVIFYFIFTPSLIHMSYIQLHVSIYALVSTVRFKNRRRRRRKFFGLRSNRGLCMKEMLLQTGFAFFLVCLLFSLLSTIFALPGS